MPVKNDLGIFYIFLIYHLDMVGFEEWSNDLVFADRGICFRQVKKDDCRLLNSHH